MKKLFKYKVGDRVMVSLSRDLHLEKKTKGVVKYYHKVELSGHNYYTVQANISIGGIPEESIELDIQYYREQRLKKILGEI